MLMPKTFPYLKISGTYKEVGRAIGKTFQYKIKKRLYERRRSLPGYYDYLGRANAFFLETQKTFPHLISELEGIAEGAGEPLEEIFFANAPEVYGIYDYDELGTYYDHCTTVASPTADGLIVGHNEDEEGSIDYLYILKATIGNNTFLGLCYVLEVPGTGMAINNSGLIQAINNLYSDCRFGIPRSFIARAMLECRSLDEAQSLAHRVKQASGYNHFLVKDNILLNIEMAGKRLSIEKIIDKPYAHTNHFISPTMERFEKNDWPGTRRRLKRVNELLRPDMTKEEIASLLSDTQDQEFPICSPKETIGSALVLPKENAVWFCYGRPCDGEYKKYTI